MLTVALLLAAAAPAPAQPSGCIGDCDGDAHVTADELWKVVNIALGTAPIATCQTDDNNDGQVTVDELVRAINNAKLNACEGEITPGPTPTPTPPTNGTNQGIGPAPRVALSTMQAVDIMDFGFVGAFGGATSAALARSGPVERLRAHTSQVLPGGAAAGQPACPGGGSAVSGQCTQGPGGFTATTVFSMCVSSADALGRTTVTNGVVLATASDPGVCTGNVPAGVEVTNQFTNFTSKTVDAAGHSIAEVSRSLMQRLSSSGTGCDGDANGTEVLDGTIHSTCDPSAAETLCNPEFADVTLSPHGLQLERQSDGTPCVTQITVAGQLDVINATSGESFSQSFNDFTVTETPQADGSVSVTERGSMTVSCLGTVEFDTKVPIRFAAPAACPSDGLFEVTRPVSMGGTAAASIADSLIAAPSKAPETSDFHTAASGQSAGYREAAFRAANGQVYQVLQNTNGNPEIGAEDFRITTLVGSFSNKLAVCAEPGTAIAVVAAPLNETLPASAVVKSDRIPDATSPCFNPNGNGGDGVVCVGPGCTDDCACASTSSCQAFTIDAGSMITDQTADIAAASVVSALSNVQQPCDGFAGRATYAFGSGGPTTAAAVCAAAPPDGFTLPSSPSAFGGTNGSTVVFAYQAPAAQPFGAGASGFAIDSDGLNTEGCTGTNRVVGGLVSVLPSVRPPRISFTAGGGVGFDFNGSLHLDKLFATCGSDALPQCGGRLPPSPVPPPATPLPCQPNPLLSVPSAGAAGDTTTGPNAFGGATCGGGGNKAPDVAFAYQAPAAGLYTIDTVGSAFDTVLYVRADDCAGAELACNDDAGNGGLQSQLAVSLTSGQRIVIVVDGFGAERGPFNLNISFNPDASTPTPTPTVPAVTAQLPDLIVSGVTAPGAGTAGGRITVSATVKNQGVLDAGAFQVAFVYSNDAVITADDTPSGFVCVFSGLASGSTVTCSGPIGVPDSLAAGTYVVGAIADFAQQVTEGNEDNNTRPADTGSIVITAPARTAIGTPTRTRTRTPTATPTPKPPPTSAPTPKTVGGFICEDTTWRLADSPFIVTRSVIVGGPICPAGQQQPTLTIEPGVVVRFNANLFMEINGTLLANGTAASPILFTSNKSTKAPGDWDGIRFQDGSQDATFDDAGGYTGGSIMEECIIEFAKDSAGTGVLALKSAAPFLHDVTVRSCAVTAAAIGVSGPVAVQMNGPKVLSNQGSIYSVGLTVASSTFRITGAVIKGNSTSGVFLAGTGTITSSTVSENLGDGIGCDLGGVTVAESVVNNNGGNGVYTFGNCATTTIVGNDISHNAGAGIQFEGGRCGGPGNQIVRQNCLSANKGTGVAGFALSDGSDAIGGVFELNTVVGHGGNQNPPQKSTIVFRSNTFALALSQNNLVMNQGFTLSYTLPNGSPILNAKNNWWGVTDPNAISDTVFDCLHDGSLACVDFTSPATGPIAGAPDIDACANGTFVPMPPP